jgi:hypothetical protein
MRLTYASFVLAAAAATVLAGPLRAQAPDSAFHRGQWGVDFAIGNGFAGAGLIHFRSPTRALVLNLSGSFATGSGTGATPAPGMNRSTVNVSLGARRYLPVAPHLEVFRTFGILGLYQHQFDGSSGTTTVSWGAGVFAAAGAGWMVTPHLALGASWTLSAQFTRATIAGSGLANPGGFNVWGVTLGTPSLTGQLYF